jgi:hypothetical protein
LRRSWAILCGLRRRQPITLGLGRLGTAAQFGDRRIPRGRGRL